MLQFSVVCSPPDWQFPVPTFPFMQLRDFVLCPPPHDALEIKILEISSCLDSKIFELWQSNSMWHVSLCSHYLHWVQSDQLDQNDNENWQDCVLHVFCIIASLFEQSFRFPTQLRDRIVIPVPHVAVQGVHVVQGPQILDSKNEKLIYWISRNCEIWIFTRPLKFHI